jgi:predicted ribosomally synthesized peptide with nif11-like leader
LLQKHNKKGVGAYMEVNQTVKNFFMKLGEDEELRGKLEAAAKRQDLAECALLSREAGFDFTRAELEYMVNLARAYQNGELNDEQLELVSGGVIIELAMLAYVLAALAALGTVTTVGLVAAGAGLGIGYAAQSSKR